MNRREGDLRLLLFRQISVDSYGKMISLETQHFNINRILLLIIGLWPYQRSPLIELQLILLFGTLISFIVFQVCRSFILYITIIYITFYFFFLYITKLYYIVIKENQNIILILLPDLNIKIGRAHV